MLCTKNSSPPLSPAGSEISVGAPSPPPIQKLQQQQSEVLPHNERRRMGDDYFRPLKRLKGINTCLIGIINNNSLFRIFNFLELVHHLIICHFKTRGIKVNEVIQ